MDCRFLEEAPIDAFRRNWRKLGFSTLLVLGLGAWVVSRSDVRVHEVWAAIRTVGWEMALLAFVGSLGQLAFLTLRVGVLVPRALHPGMRQVTYAISSGHALNTFFPARAGDLLKCFLLAQGPPTAFTVLSAAGVLVADRVVDVGTLLLMAGIWAAYRHPKMAQWLSDLSPESWAGPYWEYAALAVFAALGLTAWFVLSRRLSVRAARWSGEFRSGLTVLTQPRWTALAVALAFLSWSGEVLSLCALSHAQGVELTFGQAVFVVVALNLAISLPISFANVGPFEAAIALALTSFGMGAPAALAVATLHHGLQIIAVVLVTLGAWVLRGRTSPIPQS